MKEAIINNEKDDPSFDILKAEFDDNKGLLTFLIKNNNKKPLYFMIELTLKDQLVSSDKEVIKPESQKIIRIPTPYLWGKDIYGLTNMTLYYGNIDTLHKEVKEVLITEKKSFPLIANVILSSTNSALLTLLIITLIIFIAWKKKKKKKTTDKSK